MPLRCLVERIELIAPQPFVPLLLDPPKITGNLPWMSVECPLCPDVLNSTVTCGAIVFSKCCCTWLTLRNELLLCSYCYGDHLRDHSTVRAACNLVLDAFKHIPVTCSKCGNEILLSEYTTHLYICLSCWQCL